MYKVRIRAAMQGVAVMLANASIADINTATAVTSLQTAFSLEMQ